MGNLSFILFALVLAIFVGGCVWRMAGDDQNSAPAEVSATAVRIKVMPKLRLGCENGFVTVSAAGQHE